MKMKLFLIVVVGLLLSFCSKENRNELDSIALNVSNKSDLSCDSFKVYTRTGEKISCDSLLVKNIKSAVDTSIFWDYLNICKSDGTFSFKVFLSDGKVLNKSFGYFTNSYNPYKSFSLNIYSDSLRLNGVLK